MSHNNLSACVASSIDDTITSHQTVDHTESKVTITVTDHSDETRPGASSNRRSDQHPSSSQSHNELCTFMTPDTSRDPSRDVDQPQTSKQLAAGGPRSCHGCGCTITDRYMLEAVERYWHEACLKCSCCNCQLDILGCTLFSRGGLLLCRRDYLR